MYLNHTKWGPSAALAALVCQLLSDNLSGTQFSNQGQRVSTGLSRSMVPHDWRVVAMCSAEAGKYGGAKGGAVPCLTERATGPARTERRHGYVEGAA